ncbi:MAG: peptidoglycan-associated lipoprotein [Candidatus Electrothrix sp. AR4]|nr:peptidoglycan-associated lipoprotein [Candidatus Electrothrix sp. AR4]
MESLIEDLPGALDAEEDEDFNAPIVETLDTGSGIGEQTQAFAKDQEEKTDEYKRKHGRSSTQMKPVYYNFDQSNIRPDQVVHVEHNGEYLKSNLASQVVIEGNCDEQGTNEYNLALGERRAMNAKQYLIKLGIATSRIRTISYGEERPLFTGSEESDYSYNRRADFVLE